MQQDRTKKFLPASNNFKIYKPTRIMTKLKFLPLCLALVALISFKTSQTKPLATVETGMFKVTILYPNGDDKTFDMDYYEKKHMPMVAGFIGKNLKFYEIDKGIAGRAPNDKPPFAAIGYFYISDVAEYNKAIAQNRDAVISDFKNYTNIQPVVQISEIKKIGYVDEK
jgi:uncharacterized protein (TIGR02118 family)